MTRLFGGILLGLLPPITGRAATVVDWYSLDPANNLRLLADSGSVVAILKVTPSVGTTTALFPLAGSFADDYWLDEPGLMDSVTGDGTLGTFDVLVLPPVGGGFRYTLEVAFAEGFSGNHLAIGGVFPFAGPQVRLAAFGAGDAAQSITTLLGIYRWDAGFSAYDGPVGWDGGGQVLTFPGAPGNESGFAMFELPPGVRRLEIEVDSPLFPQPGESISFAVGFAIPEVSTMVLIAMAGGLGCLRRRRCETQGIFGGGEGEES